MDAGEMKARMEAEKKAKDEALKRKAQADILSGVRRASSAGVKPSPKPSFSGSIRGAGVSGRHIGSSGVSGVGGVGPINAPVSKFIAEYTVKKGDTLSQIAKNYYGFATQPYWKIIQEANKDIIKDANLIYPGQVFKIPALPEELKKKV